MSDKPVTLTEVSPPVSVLVSVSVDPISAPTVASSVGSLVDGHAVSPEIKATDEMKNAGVSRMPQSNSRPQNLRKRADRSSPSSSPTTSSSGPWSYQCRGSASQ